jgi:hypothetical protein
LGKAHVGNECEEEEDLDTSVLKVESGEIAGERRGE